MASLLLGKLHHQYSFIILSNLSFYGTTTSPKEEAFLKRQ